MMKYLITPSLLNSWQWYMKAGEEYEDSAKADFLGTLRKIPFQPTEAIKRGIKFESDIYAYCDGYRPPIDDEYWQCVDEIAGFVIGGARQVVCKSDIVVCGQPVLIYGKADCVRGPVCSDIKFKSSQYVAPAFQDSPQASLYLHCLGQVPIMQFLISDGKRCYVEQYMKSDCRSAHEWVGEFLDFIWQWDEAKEAFIENWKARE